MSQENVEIIRTMYETASPLPLAGLDFLAPEIEFHLSGVFPDLDPVYRGHEGIQKFVDQFSEPWEELSLEPDRFIDIGAQVLVLSHFHARGRDGIEVRLPFAHLWTLRDRLAVRMDAFSDQQKALEAVGLSEQDGDMPSS
jgi:ketosteroid isomerase-like protein